MLSYRPATQKSFLQLFPWIQWKDAAGSSRILYSISPMFFNSLIREGMYKTEARNNFKGSRCIFCGEQNVHLCFLSPKPFLMEAEKANLFLFKLCAPSANCSQMLPDFSRRHVKNCGCYSMNNVFKHLNRDLCFYIRSLSYFKLYCILIIYNYI